MKNILFLWGVHDVCLRKQNQTPNLNKFTSQIFHFHMSENLYGLDGWLFGCLFV